MDVELKNKWVAALRSGEYTQATSYLRDPNDAGFCCLGVLCDVVDPNGWEKRPVKMYGDESRQGYIFDFSRFGVDRPSDYTIEADSSLETLQPNYVRDYLGLNEKAEIKDKHVDLIHSASIWDILTDMNDSKTKSFSDIADWIEANL